MIGKEEIERMYDLWRVTIEDEPIALETAFTAGGLCVAARLNRQWVSVSERHPEPLKDVLVVSAQGVINIAKWSETLQTWLSRHNIDTITHWRELPNLPNK
jgi:hypothetical protein